MSEIKDGGSAFPRAGNEWEEMSWVPAAAEKGMTLRDYFAAQAMQALLIGGYENITKGYWNATPKKAYEMADLMLQERGKNHE
jgi:hypothetical protein